MLRRAVLLFLFSPLLLGPGALAAKDTVIVKKGDTLYRIARRSGLSVERLRTLNDLKNNTIRPGQILRVSGKAPAPARSNARSAPAPSVYTVRPGDTLGHVA
ncbi:MAG: LysM peptidoglycan-binding domain-containing protein, partial [Deinococcota bacterium]